MKKTYIIHPFLFAIYSVLFLFSHNIGQLLLSEIMVPIIVAFFFSFLLWLLLSFFFKEREKRGIVAILFLLLFFSYGHFYELADKMFKYKLMEFVVFFVGRQPIGPYKILFFLWCIILSFGIYFIKKSKRNLSTLTSILNVASIFLVASTLFNIGIRDFKRREIWQDKKSMGNLQYNTAGLEETKKEILPDIYYIILDMYTSSSNLKEYFDYDNSEFIGFLRNKGFYVADKSNSNYAYSCFSLASSLNMTYLNNLVDEEKPDSEDYSIPFKMIRDNNVVRFLKERGYKFVLFASGYYQPTTRNRYADFVVNPCRWSDAFSTILVESTMIGRFLKPFLKADHRNRILTTLSRLPEIHKEIKGPKFVFAHIVSPHFPFVFGPNGEVRQIDFLVAPGGDARKYKKPYLDQLIFINEEIKVLVNRILSESDTRPIIIIQGDHGTIMVDNYPFPSEILIKQQMRILNAYYLPEDCRNFLYNSITPVNSFRLIFKHYFGADYDLLEDKSYYSEDRRKYNFVDVTDMVKVK